ncbi:MAG: hypothetical protein O9296_18465, partial [Novosphingobium sp.]|nr:hypothetical protein [Novosphingobium sp.]
PETVVQVVHLVRPDGGPAHPSAVGVGEAGLAVGGDVARCIVRVALGGRGAGGRAETPDYVEM